MWANSCQGVTFRIFSEYEQQKLKFRRTEGCCSVRLLKILRREVLHVNVMSLIVAFQNSRLCANNVSQRLHNYENVDIDLKCNMHLDGCNGHRKHVFV